MPSNTAGLFQDSSCCVGGFRRGPLCPSAGTCLWFLVVPTGPHEASRMCRNTCVRFFFTFPLFDIVFRSLGAPAPQTSRVGGCRPPKSPTGDLGGGNAQPVMRREREPPWGNENTYFVVATGLACSASILHFMFLVWTRDLPRNGFIICLRG